MSNRSSPFVMGQLVQYRSFDGKWTHNLIFNKMHPNHGHLCCMTTEEGLNITQPIDYVYSDDCLYYSEWDKPVVKWSRSQESFYVSKCGRFELIPEYYGSVSPRNYQLVIDFGAGKSKPYQETYFTVKEAKRGVEWYLARYEGRLPPLRSVSHLI